MIYRGKFELFLYWFVVCNEDILLKRNGFGRGVWLVFGVLNQFVDVLIGFELYFI